MKTIRLLGLVWIAALYLSAQVDPSIPLRVIQPKLNDPLDSLAKAQQIRATQLENQRAADAAATQNQRGQEARKESARQAPSQPNPANVTIGLLNGRAWNAAPPDHKISYLKGFMEAHTLWEVDMEPQRGSPQLKSFVFGYPESLTPQEISQSLDQFYTEPTNRLIPIAIAMTWVDLKAKGASVSELADRESGLRSLFANTK